MAHLGAAMLTSVASRPGPLRGAPHRRISSVVDLASREGGPQRWESAVSALHACSRAVEQEVRPTVVAFRGWQISSPLQPVSDPWSPGLTSGKATGHIRFEVIKMARASKREE